MSHLMVRKWMGIFVLAEAVALAAPGMGAAMGKIATVKPVDNGAELRNPGMGWMLHYYDNAPTNYGSRLAPSDTLPNWPGLNLIYLRIPWAYIEPEEGVFNWSVLDTPMQRFTGRGIQAGFRITCSESWMEYATPEWVRKAGAKGYRFNPSKGIQADGPYWEPDYDDPIFLAKLDHFLAAMAARYDGHPDVAFVEVGSFGVWGEGHTWASTRKAYPVSTIERHIDLYRKNFKQTTLIGMDDFVSRPGTETPLQAGFQRRSFDLVVPFDWRGRAFRLIGVLCRPGAAAADRLLPWNGEADRAISLGKLEIDAAGGAHFTPTGKPLPTDAAAFPDAAQCAASAGIRYDPVWQPHSLKIDLALWLRGPEANGVQPFLHLLDAQTGKEVMMPREEREDEALTRYMTERGLGLRDDSILVAPPPTGYFHAGMAQAFWRKSPTIIESEHYGGSAQRGCWADGSGFLQSIEDYHASWASIHWWPDEFLEKNRELVRRINLRIGYRFLPVELSWPETLSLGERMPVRWQWRNAGVAPCYRDAYPCLTLKDSKGGLAAVLVDEQFNLRQLPVGRADGVPAQSKAREFLLPFQLGAGEYEVFVSVGDRLGKPEIALPLAGDDGARRYRIGRCTIQGDYRADVAEAKPAGGNLALTMTWTAHHALPAGTAPFFHVDLDGKLIPLSVEPEGDTGQTGFSQPGATTKRYTLKLPALKPGETATLLAGLWVPERIGHPDERLNADNGESDRRVRIGRITADAGGTLHFAEK